MRILLSLLFLIFLTWFKIAILPVGVEVTLIALLVFTFILTKYEVIFAAAAVGLMLDYFSILPFGIVTFSIITSVVIFLFWKKKFNTDAKGLVVVFLLMILLYNFIILKSLKVLGYIYDTDYMNISLKILLSKISPQMAVLNIILILLSVYFLNKKYIYGKSFRV